jgi:enoyl-CoA hydratase/carnithine racemase
VTPGVRLDLDGPVATVTLGRPEVLNAQTPEMWAALRGFARELPGDVRIVVVRGEGRAFSAGLDLTAAGAGPGQSRQDEASSSDSASANSERSGEGDGGTFAELLQLSPDDAEKRIAQIQEAFSWLRHPRLISIAAVQGHAIGAGFQLALACDMRVLADNAMFTMAEVSLGLVPDLGGTKRLVELIGYGRALELCVTGRRIAADEAARIGLANLVVPLDELAGAVSDLSAAILAASRDAVTEIKALLTAAGGRDFAAQEAAERAAQVRRIRDLAGMGE